MDKVNVGDIVCHKTNKDIKMIVIAINTYYVPGDYDDTTCAYLTTTGEHKKERFHFCELEKSN